MTSHDSNNDSPRRDRLWSRVGWGLVVLGWLLALGRYVARLGLRYDESRVTLNLLERDYAGLLQPLNYDQGAPVGFLWVHRAMIDWVSFSEWGAAFTDFDRGVADPLVGLGCGTTIGEPDGRCAGGAHGDLSPRDRALCAGQAIRL